MERLYKKDELNFALLWIGIYVVLDILADKGSAMLGYEKILTAPVNGTMTAYLWWWLKRQGLLQKYGLCAFRGSLKAYLYFLPLVVIMSCNLWDGVTMNLSVTETVLYVMSMIFVGFLEEVIFRGFLFKALCRDSVKQAILISSLTFSIGHIVNLLNGAELVPTLLQICYAAAIGFLFTVIFYKSGSIIPCIVTHSVVNSLNVFGVDSTGAQEIVCALILTVVSAGYAVWILKKKE